MGINWDNRNYGEDPPTEEDLERADRREQFETHRLHECDREDCYPCSGGLSLCTVCGGAEGSMPYSCPGVKMTEKQQDDVMAQRFDFIHGEWRVPPPKRTRA